MDAALRNGLSHFQGTIPGHVSRSHERIEVWQGTGSRGSQSLTSEALTAFAVPPDKSHGR
jgi:hypothetical protein